MSSAKAVVLELWFSSYGSQTIVAKASAQAIALTIANAVATTAIANASTNAMVAQAIADKKIAKVMLTKARI